MGTNSLDRARSVRRWLVTSAAFALSSALAGPSCAATQGSFGATSTGTVSISASVPARARITGLVDVGFIAVQAARGTFSHFNANPDTFNQVGQQVFMSGVLGLFGGRHRIEPDTPAGTSHNPAGPTVSPIPPIVPNTTGALK